MNIYTGLFGSRFAGALCVGILLLGVRHGLGISPDSTLYLRSSRALVAGHGMTVSDPAGNAYPVTAVPPGYPLILAAGAATGLAEFRSAWLINGALFVAVLYFCLIIIESVIGEGAWSLWGALMIGTNVSVLNNYSMMWSEPLFFTSMIGGIAGVLKVISDGHWRWIWITSLAFAAACVTRYAGISIVPAVAISLLLFGPWPIARRMWITAFVVAATSTPLLVWIVRNLVASGGAVGRTVAVHPIDAAHLRSLSLSFQDWIAPEHLRSWIRTAMLIASGVGAITVFIQRRLIVSARTVTKPLIVLAIFVLTYFWFIVASITFVDFATPLDYRILAPVFILLLIAASIIFETVIVRASGITRRVIATVATILVLGSIIAMMQWMTARDGYGDGFTSRQWQQSETIAAIRQFRPDLPLITNGHEPVYALTGRVVFPLPEKIDGASGLVRRSYNSELRETAKRLQQGAVLVYFTNLPDNGNAPSIEEVVSLIGPLHVTKFSDGTAYSIKTPR